MRKFKGSRWLPVFIAATLMPGIACTGSDAAPTGGRGPSGGSEETDSPTDPNTGDFGDGSENDTGTGPTGANDNAGRPAAVPSREARETFPTGLAVASPADINQDTQFTFNSSPSTSGARYARDLGNTFWNAATNLDAWALASLLDDVLPIATRAEAASGNELELKALALTVQAVLAGGSGATLDDVLDLDGLFFEGGNANCYGPEMAYAMHEDARAGEMAAGRLPTGDLGMWLEHEGGGEKPCVAAQLSRRIAGVKGKTQQGLLLTAAMRRSVEEDADLDMPAAGGATDATGVVSEKLKAIERLSQVTIHAASIALSADGGIYTYRLALDRGSSGMQAGFGEVVMRHAPGSDDTEFSGVLQVATFSLTNDQVFGCDEQRDADTNAMQAASVATIKYSRSGSRVAFGSRSANYCGHPKDTASDGYAEEVAALGPDGQLDLGAKRWTMLPPPGAGPTGPPSGGDPMEPSPPPGDPLLPPPPGGDPMEPPPGGDPREPPPPDGGIPLPPPGPEPGDSDPKGWIGNCTRFAGNFDFDTVEGDFLFAWQAGTGDSHARSLALDTTFDSVSESRTLQGFFAFADDISTTDGTLLGLICNWAGPGNSHAPQALFQSQVATLEAGGSGFVVTPGGSKLTYAPTNSCSSTTTEYDMNADRQLDPGEGAEQASDLDSPADTRTVHEEVESRGFSIPQLY